MGRGTKVYFPNYFANAGNMFIGRNVVIYPNCWIMAVGSEFGGEATGKVYVGDSTVISWNSQITIASELKVGRGVGIGRGTVIADHSHDYRYIGEGIVLSPRRPYRYQDEVFLAECFIGRA
jgi:acetyltransferase-like isoleucine patch superfamily enzyme